MRPPRPRVLGCLLAGALLIGACRSSPSEPAPRPKPSADPALQTLKLDGVEVQVPRAMVPLEPDRVKRLEDAARRQEADGAYTVAAVRDVSGMMAGTVYVQKTDVARTWPGFKDVRAALQATLRETTDLLAASGVRILHTEQSERDGGLEVCWEAQMGSSGKVAALNVCTLFYIAQQGQGLRGLTVNCMMRPGEALCARVLDSRKYTADRPMPLDAGLSQAPPAGLTGVGKSAAAGLRFGSSKASFVTDCHAARHEVDAFDWANEPRAVHTWVKQGRMAQCSGPLAPVEWANIVQVNVIFHEGRLASASLFVANEQHEIQRKLAEAYPDSTMDMGRSVHLINREAQGAELVSVAVGPTRVPGAKSVVTFLSRAGMDMPPLVP